mmetsp:Transcript_27581/g.40552  ORF Transcript_27581/g.40552 Transcript_27581/m.40552 type:complete len:253 (-) Transcript_27581:5078-5836(-)
MILERAVCPKSNIIDVDVNIQSSKNLCDNRLRFIRRTLESHCQSLVSELAVWSNNGTELFGFIVQFHRVIHHSEIELGEVRITRTLCQNFLNVWKWVHFSFESFVQFTHIGDPTNTTIPIGVRFLRNNESWTRPFRRSDWFEHANIHQMFELFEKNIFMHTRNSIRFRMNRCEIRINFQMNEFVSIVAQITVEKNIEFGECFCKLSTLKLCQMNLFVGNFLWRHLFIFRFRDVAVKQVLLIVVRIIESFQHV